MLQAKARGPPAKETNLPRYVEPKPEGIVTRPRQKYMFRVEKSGWTSSTEIIHLSAASIIIMAVGLSWGSPQLEWIYRIFSDPVGTLAWGAFFTAIFLTHELAHKAAAKHYGLWAEFRISVLGAAFTMLSVMTPLIKIISPGAVMIAGAANRKIIGVTALAGPLASIMVASILLSTYLFFPVSLITLNILIGASISAWIAVFNLIPLAMLDGAKIFWWNKANWAASFAGAAILTVVTFTELAPYA
jgi:Zn-dependent protease